MRYVGAAQFQQISNPAGFSSPQAVQAKPTSPPESVYDCTNAIAVVGRRTRLSEDFVRQAALDIGLVDNTRAHLDEAIRLYRSCPYDPGPYRTGVNPGVSTLTTAALLEDGGLPRDTIVACDVGQGDAILVEGGSGGRLLIETQNMLLDQALEFGDVERQFATPVVDAIPFHAPLDRLELRPRRAPITTRAPS